MKIDHTDEKIIRFLQDDIPLVSNPFAVLAEDLEISEAMLLERIERLKNAGILRRWGAVLRHQKAGYHANAMVAWNVDPAKADMAGEMLASRKEVSHCYLREVPEDFGYDLFTMVHARDEQELKNTIHLLSELSGLNHYVVLKSIREFKKVSMRYI